MDGSRNLGLLAEYMTYLRVEKGLRPLTCEAYLSDLKTFAKQDPDLVTAQHPPSAVNTRVRNRDGAPVGVRIIRKNDVGRSRARQSERQVDRTWLLWVRKCHGGEIRIRCALLRNN